MAEQSLDVKTDEIYGRNNEKGKEMKNYQDAEKQILAIQAAQQQNLRAGKLNNLAQYRNTQNLIGAGNAMSQANAGNQQQTQQVAVNPQTQQILQKYGASKPGTVTKTTHSQQVTKQNITINNNTTNTTNNTVRTVPAQQQVIRPQKDNSNEKFKLWLNNTLARQQEDYARREKDYDKRETALTRDSNKMLRKLGEFSKDIMEKMDPRNIGSTATSQIKSLLFIFGFQYLASNWTKIIKTVGSIEKSIKKGLTYFGLYNMNGQDTGFTFRPGESQLALDLKGLLTGEWGTSPLWYKGEKVSIQGRSSSDGTGGLMGIFSGSNGDGGFINGLKKVLFGNTNTGGKDKGLVEIIKEYFTLQGKKRMDAAKMIEKPEFSLGDPAASIRELGDYLGQLLRIFLGDPDEALKDNIKLKISLAANQRSIINNEHNEAFEKMKVDVKGSGEVYEANKGAYGILHGKHKGVTARMLNSDGELTRGDAESTIGQGSELLRALNAGLEDGELDTGIMATGFSRLYDRAKEEGKVAVGKDVAETFLPKDKIDELKKSGDITEKEYTWVLRQYKGIDDTFTDKIRWWQEFNNRGTLQAGEQGIKDKQNYTWRMVPVENPGPMDKVTHYKDFLYELTPKAIETILKYRTGDGEFNIDLGDEGYINAIDNWAVKLMTEKSHLKDPDRYLKREQNNWFFNKQLNGLNIDDEQSDIWDNRHIFYQSDNEEDLKRLNTYNRDQILKEGKETLINEGKNSLLRAYNDVASINGSTKGNKARFRDAYVAMTGGKGQQGYAHSNTVSITGRNKETGEEIVIDPEMLQNKTSQEIAILLKNLEKYEFGSSSVDFDKVNESANSQTLDDLMDILKKYSPAKNKDGYSNGFYDKYLKDIESITAEELNDPKKLKEKIDRILKKYTLDDEGKSVVGTVDLLKGGAELVAASKAHAMEASNLVNNLIDVSTAYKESVPAEWEQSMRSAVSDILNNAYRFRKQAEDKYADDLSVAKKLKTDANLRYKLSNDIEYEGGDIRGEYSAYNDYRSKYIDRENQISEDIGNNAVTSKTRDIVNSALDMFNNATEGADKYTKEAREWLGSLFKQNVNPTINNFIKNLNYTNVSLSRYPEGTRIKQGEGLLLWYCFNPPKNIENKTNIVDFVVRDASGRFGAGRKNGTGTPWAKKEGELWDRIHSGQDISLFYVDGKEMPKSSVKPYFYAPFNGYLEVCGNGGSGRQLLLRQAKEDGKGPGGRFSVYVCHLSSISNKAWEYFNSKTNRLVPRGTELGVMGGSGYKTVIDPVTKKPVKGPDGKNKKEWSEEAYGAHFHINILDNYHPGPFDGPFEHPLPDVSPEFKGFKYLSPKTNEHAVDPLFVFVDEMTGEFSNDTLYLTEDRKVVNIEDFDKTGKGVSSDGTELFKGAERTDKAENSTETKEGEGEAKEDEESEEGSLSLWNWASDLFQKLFSGGLSGLWDKTKEYGEKARDTFKDLFGKYRNKSMSFRKSLSNYSGVITPEFVNYQNYLKNPGKIKLGEDGKPLSETEWRNEVFDMTGSDPVSLKLGEIVNNNGKSVTEIGGDTEQTINKYSGNSNTTIVNNNSDGSTINNESTDISTTSTPKTEVSLAEARNSDIFNGKSLMDIWKESGKDPKDYLAELVNIASKQLEATTTGIVATAQGQDATIAAINAGTDATNVSTEAIIKTRSNNNRVIISGNSNVDGSKVG